MDRRAFLVDEHRDHSMCNSVRAASNPIDLVVGQVECVVAEKLATPLDRDLVVRSTGWKDLVHRNALHNLASVIVGIRAQDVEGFAETSRSMAQMRASLPSSRRAT